MKEIRKYISVILCAMLVLSSLSLFSVSADTQPATGLVESAEFVEKLNEYLDVTETVNGHKFFTTENIREHIRIFLETEDELIFGLRDSLCSVGEEVIGGYKFENPVWFGIVKNECGFCVYKNGTIYSFREAVEQEIEKVDYLAELTGAVKVEPETSYRDLLKAKLQEQCWNDESWFFEKYTLESYTEYAIAYRKANKTAYDEKTSEADCQKAYEKLMRAYAALKEVQNESEFINTDNIIDAYQNILNYMPVGGTPYTTESSKAFQTALKNLEKLLNELHPSDIYSLLHDGYIPFVEAHRGLEHSKADRSVIWMMIDALEKALRTLETGDPAVYSIGHELYSEALPIAYYEPEQSVIDECSAKIDAFLKQYNTDPTTPTQPATGNWENPEPTEAPVTSPTEAPTQAPTELPAVAPTIPWDYDLSHAIVTGIEDKPFIGGEVIQDNIVVKVRTEAAWYGVDSSLTRTLEKNEYTVSYDNNVNVGTAKIIIEGRLGFYGKYEDTFEIKLSDFPEPTQIPTYVPTEAPTQISTSAPSQTPTETPTQAPTQTPVDSNLETPTDAPTAPPTVCPTKPAKKTNPMTVKVAGKAVSFKKLKIARLVVLPITVKKAQGKLVFQKLSGSSKLAINSVGKVVVKKGTKKGLYKIRVKITAKGNSKYKSKSQTVIVKVRVK